MGEGDRPPEQDPSTGEKGLNGLVSKIHQGPLAQMAVVFVSKDMYPGHSHEQCPLVAHIATQREARIRMQWVRSNEPPSPK
jgi:hypothetical protein